LSTVPTEPTTDTRPSLPKLKVLTSQVTPKKTKIGTTAK
jgi:hypothetical protein